MVKNPPAMQGSPWGHKESDITERLHFTISSPGKRTGVIMYHFIELGLFPGGSEVKVSACNVGDLGSIPGSRRSPGEGDGNPLQYSCLENPMGRGAWRAIVHRVTELDTTEVTEHTHTRDIV